MMPLSAEFGGDGRSPADALAEARATSGQPPPRIRLRPR